MVSVLVDEEKIIKFKRKSIGYSPNNGGDVNRLKEEELKGKREHTGDDTFIETDEGISPESLGLIVKRVLENGRKG